MQHKHLLYSQVERAWIMNRLQSRLAIALLFGGLFILTFLAATLVSGPINFLYRSAAGLTTIRSIAQVTAILAAIVLFLAACVVAIPTAFQPTSRLRKVLYILPIYLLGFTLLVILSSFIGIGMTGALFSLGMTPLTLSATAIILGAVFSVIAVVIAAGRVPLAERPLQTAMTLMTVTTVPGVIAAICLI